MRGTSASFAARGSVSRKRPIGEGPTSRRVKKIERAFRANQREGRAGALEKNREFRAARRGVGLAGALGHGVHFWAAGEFRAAREG